MASTGPRKRVKTSSSGGDDGARSSSAGRDELAPPTQRKAVSWYPGVWPASRSSKAAPVTEVARESISVAKNVASDLTSVSTPQLNPSRQHRSPSLHLTRKAGASTRSLPADATTTRVNIASDGSASSPTVDSQPAPVESTSDSIPKETSGDKGNDIGPNTQQEHLKAISGTPNSNTGAKVIETAQESIHSTQPSGWFSWFYSPSTSDINNTENPTTQAATEDTVTQTPSNPSDEDQGSKEEAAPVADQHDLLQQNKAPEVSEVPTASERQSWLQMWYGASSTKGGDALKSEPPENETPKGEPAKDGPPQSNPPLSIDYTGPSSTDTGPQLSQQAEDHQQNDDSNSASVRTSKASGWSFWFKESSQDPTKGKPQELQAVEPSISPELPSKLVRDGPDSEPEQKPEPAKKGGTRLKSPKSSSALPDKAPATIDTPSGAPETAASKQLQKILPNQVLPLFEDTFAVEERPSFLQTIGRFLHYSKEPNNKHVHMIRDPPQIKRALAIGVHGYFPAPLIRTVLGQPTGTSIRFSNMAADSIRKWSEDHGHKCDIEKIALEGEGRIAERVDVLWKLLLNWVEEIRKADFILVACHSQGVPVAIMLVAKLIAFGCLNATRVGVCAMAGVNLGPFPDYRSRWISGSAGELFEFALPYSQVSKDYEAALKTSLDFGVRISYVGSIDDQLVSLESSLFSPVSHPYIYRAVFVDGRVHAPSFLSHLVGFALKLRNLGISDHGLMRELSSPLAGSLYTGDGHSRLYDDEAVYQLAIAFALETSIVPTASLNVKRAHPSPTVNPYILPFAMRGLLEEEYVRRELYDETMELLRQFDDWKPTSKVLRDVKFRLEGIRSKL
ncbi:hypothetical protein FE257_006485 [Aspergillus nanangensis]|uniref:YMC020W-like alpha/beta hydrolase domain-containing protein n=1 Tax=Aspergillus nanangensis TaxID=2582783 RepID=A0AAD4GZ15_ASPNN|nr:hypothetical protein FE257_006485 [Aspergillus nanangensis]